MYLSEKTHKSGQITVRLVAHSSSSEAPDIATFELEYPRFIHSELMTHRVMSRNAMSSRAVPIAKMIEQVRTNPAMPIHWGANQSGMQADNECSNPIDLGAAGVEFTMEEAWRFSAKTAADYAERMSEAGYHKQIVNRILEPYQRMKTIVTSTEWDNFFELRCHKDAQPEIQELAVMMQHALEMSDPEPLFSGEWHTPYVRHQRDMDGVLHYYVQNSTDDAEYVSGQYVSAEEALKVSASCCAQVSYRLLDNSLDKALMVYDRLVTSRPIHASPFEHQAQVVVETADNNYVADSTSWSKGMTHADWFGNLWSGNFKGWIQYRQLLA